MKRILFVYLGRRGAMARFTFELAEAMREIDDIEARFLISDVNELAHLWRADPRFYQLRMFRGRHGAVSQLWRVPHVRQSIVRLLREMPPALVVELMPHVWSPLLDDLPAKAGARRAVVVHDWIAHPGDIAGVANEWLKRSALRADCILTLSRSVARQVSHARPELAAKVRVLFHPDFPSDAPPPQTTGVLSVLFLGRLLAYKGLDLLLDAVAEVRARGGDVELTVAGDGDISAFAAKLRSLRALVVNRWLSDADITALLSASDVVAASHKEASQSGVVAAAFGAGRPVIATPVGALPEQVVHERTGLITQRVDSDAIADALMRLVQDRELLARLAATVRAEAEQRSMKAFALALTAAACGQD